MSIRGTRQFDAEPLKCGDDAASKVINTSDFETMEIAVYSDTYFLGRTADQTKVAVPNSMELRNNTLPGVRMIQTNLEMLRVAKQRI